MINEPSNSPARVAVQRPPSPVRVKIYRADGKLAPVHCPDGEGKIWWRRLKNALGTTSSDFVNASLFQLQSACRSPWGGISELAMNAALALSKRQPPKTKLKMRSTSKWPARIQPPWRFLQNWMFLTERRVAFGSTRLA